MALTRRDLLQKLPALPLGAGLLWSGPAVAQEHVRIAVGRFRGKLSISGAGLRAKGADGVQLSSRDTVTLNASAGGISLAGKVLPYELLRFVGDDALEVKGHRYRKFLEVHWREYQGRPELLVVHPLPMESYVAGIVSSELPHRWPYEALKVQAICARTYAVWQKYRRLHLPYHLESSVLDQVYKGAQREHEDAHRAARDTAGQLLVFRRRPVRAYFHSTCGGHTESAAAGWGTPLAYLPGTKCPYCQRAPLYRWQAKLSADKLERAFRHLIGGPVRSLEIVSRSGTQRALKVKVRGARKSRTIRGDKLRQLCGYNVLWSTWFDRLDVVSGGLIASGRGAGHGVGMCQWGARGMAENGDSFERIVKHYYPGATLQRMY